MEKLGLRTTYVSDACHEMTIIVEDFKKTLDTHQSGGVVKLTFLKLPRNPKKFSHSVKLKERSLSV